MKIKIFWPTAYNLPYAASSMIFQALEVLERRSESDRREIHLAIENSGGCINVINSGERYEWFLDITDATLAIRLRDVVSFVFWIYGLSIASLEFVDRDDLNAVLLEIDTLREQLREAKLCRQQLVDAEVSGIKLVVRQAVTDLKKTRRLFGSKEIAKARQSLEAVISD